MRIVDLSHPITEDMPVWPGSPAPVFSPLGTIASDGFAEQLVALGSHTGTHLDAPAHMIEGGRTLDSFDAAWFCGKGGLVDLDMHDGHPVRRDELLRYQQLFEESDYLLLRTGWSRYWGMPGYFYRYPVLDPDTASWIAMFSLKGVGIDAPSFDIPDSRDYPVHKAFLGQDTLLVENLSSLDLLPEAGFMFCVFPPRIVRAEASPVRAVAML